MSEAVLSIGSNIGDRLGHLRTARAAFAPYLVGASAVFQTPPWGVTDQAPFLNAVLLVRDPDAGPAQWLARAQACEQAAGRTRTRRWGPRTLDVDVIAVDDVVSDDPVLTLPHPRAAERAFVLVPWLSADPEAALPGLGSVRDLLAGLATGEVEAVQVRPDLDLAP
jgi:2-amino-4-hydroxy-6-hydroxymethyldihydropteridine diphosphokinase